jgi:hypothetical protein
MPGIFSCIRAGPWPSRSEDSPICGGAARHPSKHWRRGRCGWLIENIDATDHPIDSVRRDFNEVIKRLLGEGVAYDAISVGSYAHRYRRYWQNMIPGPLLHEMVEKRFLMQSVDQHV